MTQLRRKLRLQSTCLMEQLRTLLMQMLTLPRLYCQLH